MSTSPARHFEVLITASEAYPRLEQAFMETRQNIIAGFRVFDPWTQLRSEGAKACGDTWFDLIVATLNRGVEIQIILTDFDPVVRMDMHLYAWRCMRGLVAAGEASQFPQNLELRVTMHPARVGLLPRMALWPRSVKEVSAKLAQIMQDNGLSGPELIALAPGIRPLVAKKKDGLRARIFPPPALVPVTHHQKLAVFDDQHLYIGGLDLNDRRYDTPAHKISSPDTWHDVQVFVDGPVAAEARRHLEQMEDGFSGRATPRPQHLLRTMSAKRRFALPYMSPVPTVSEIADAHHVAVDRSEQLIYLETQFFRDETFARHLAKRARAQPGLTLVMLLPAAPEDIAFSDSWGPDAAFGEHLQAKCLQIMQDAFAERAFVGAPVQPRTHITTGRDTHFDAPIVYLHAKVSLFDDHTGIISSANLNGRSLSWDTEAGVQTQTTSEVAQIKRRCFDHWLGAGADDAFYQSRTACDAWAARAAQNAQSVPEDRIGFVLPYLPEQGRKDAQPLPGVPSAMA